MINDFGAAIGRTGGTALLPWLDNAAVTMSIQPDGFLGEAREEAGVGAVCRYKFFTPYDAVTERLNEGSEIIFAEKRYVVECITTAYLSSRAVYRKGTLLQERETGYE